MNTLDLPKGYVEKKLLDLNNSKHALFLNAISTTFVIISLILLCLYAITSSKIDNQNLVFNITIVFLFSPIYIVAHEALHGITIKILSGFKVNYGIKGFYAYAGNSQAFFNKKTFITIALAPLVVIGSMLIFLSIIDPENIFIYLLLHIINVTSSIGDLYCSYITFKMPNTVLINDSGTQMTFYN